MSCEILYPCLYLNEGQQCSLSERCQLSGKGVYEPNGEKRLSA